MPKAVSAVPADRDHAAEKFLSDLDLASRYGVHRATVWRWVRDRDYPAPIRLGASCTRWRQSEVLAWESRAEK